MLITVLSSTVSLNFISVGIWYLPLSIDLVRLLGFIIISLYSLSNDPKEELSKFLILNIYSSFMSLLSISNIIVFSGTDKTVKYKSNIVHSFSFLYM